MKSKCNLCPLAGEDIPCLGIEDERFPYFCRWAESGVDSERSHIVGRSKIAQESAATAVSPTTSGSAVDPAPVQSPEPRMAPAPNPRLAAQLKLQALVMKCPQRDTSVPCGCGMAVCRLNKGGGIDPTRVALWECEACVAATEMAS